MTLLSILLLCLLFIVALARFKWLSAGIAAFLERRRRNRLGWALFGNPGLPFVGNLLDVPRNSFRTSEYFIESANRAADAGEHFHRWWMGSNLLVITCDGEAAETILKSTTEHRKDYVFFKQWLGDGLLLSEGKLWHTHRKLLSPVFHAELLDDYVRVFDDHAKKLVKILQTKSGQLFDVFPAVKATALDIIGESALGVKFNSKHDSDREFSDLLTRFNELNYMQTFTPFSSARWVWRLLYGSEAAQVIRNLKAFTKKEIKKRIEETKHAHKSQQPHQRRMAFLDLLLTLFREGELSFEQMHDQVDTFIFAGHETTAHAIGWTLWCLATHSTVQKRVFDEINEHLNVGNGENNEIGDDELTVQKLGKFRYLDACIKEAMRVFPIVPFVKRNLREDLKIGKHVLPRGTNIFIASLAMHHNRSVWGPDHDCFDPSRFVDRIANNPYDYIPFSAGPRNCIGQKFAMLEMRTLIIHILRAFRLSTPYEMHDNKRSCETVLRPSLGFPVQLTPLWNTKGGLSAHKNEF